MLSPCYDELKTWLELLGREAPTLLSLGCPPVACNIDGIEQQVMVGKTKNELVGVLYFGRLDSKSDIGYTIKQFPVELKHALNLIRTLKKRKS